MIRAIIAIAVALVVGLSGASATVIGANNTCVRMEKSIEAQYTQNKNNYDSYFKKLKETAQVSDVYAEDLRKVFNDAISARYGPDGSQAAFQWLKEHNPNLDPTMYRQIQQVIEAGRNDFEVNQKALIDKKRVYQTYLGEFPSGALAGLLGFPKIDLDQFDIVTSVDTDQTFDQGTSDPINLR